MSDKKLVIDGNSLISDAFDALPVFYSGEGEPVSGLYGACFKLKESFLSGSYSEVEISFAEDAGDVPAIKGQTERFKAILEDAGIDTEGTTAITDSITEKLVGSLQGLSPDGKVKELPRFTYSFKVTSDLAEVEDVFKRAGEAGDGRPDRYAGFYFILNDAAGGKKSGISPLGMAFCFDSDTVIYIKIENFITAEYLGGKLRDLSNRISLTTFDIKESYRYFEPAEISNRRSGYDDGDETFRERPRCFDALIGAYLCNPIKNDYEPWDISREYLDIPMATRADTFGKTSFADAKEEKVSEYAARVAAVCYAAAPLIRKKLIKLGMEKLFYNIEMPLSYILFSMEKEGIIAKKEALKEYGERLTSRIGELERVIYEAAGCEFNINSPKQLGEILFERLGLPAEKKTKSGYSTAADVLEKLAPDHPIVADILEYRGLAKLKSTYADGLISFIEEDDRIHTSFNQTITATGRISSTEPNLQNIPMRTELGRLIRKVFVPREGYVFADADYSQIELRILAHMSEDEGLIAAYHEGDDIHAITASKVFHVPFEEVTPLMRRNAKAVNFGIVYGISSFGLSQDLSISVGEAKEYMEKYFETYPGVRLYQDRVIQEARDKGYSTTMYGRRRPIPELKSQNFNLRQFGERVAMNAPIQGTAADIMKIAMIDVFFRLKRDELKSRLILQIHDELVIETAPDEVESVCSILKEEMESAAELSVPMEVDCHTGSDWYEAK